MLRGVGESKEKPKEKYRNINLACGLIIDEDEYYWQKWKDRQRAGRLKAGWPKELEQRAED